MYASTRVDNATSSGPDQPNQSHTRTSAAGSVLMRYALGGGTGPTGRLPAAAAAAAVRERDDKRRGDHTMVMLRFFLSPLLTELNDPCRLWLNRIMLFR